MYVKCLKYNIVCPGYNMNPSCSPDIHTGGCWYGEVHYEDDFNSSQTIELAVILQDDTDIFHNGF